MLQAPQYDQQVISNRFSSGTHSWCFSPCTGWASQSYQISHLCSLKAENTIAATVILKLAALARAC